MLIFKLNRSQWNAFTFLFGLDSVFDGADGSKTGLVFRLFENFLRFRLSAANAPNPREIWNKNQMNEKCLVKWTLHILIIFFLKEISCVLFCKGELRFEKKYDLRIIFSRKHFLNQKTSLVRAHSQPTQTCKCLNECLER